jgi:transposase
VIATVVAAVAAIGGLWAQAVTTYVSALADSAAGAPAPGGIISALTSAYSSHRNRRYLRRRQIKHTIPEPGNQRANRKRRCNRGGRPNGFDKTIYKRRNEVERTINAVKNFRAVATRFDKCACVFQGTVTVVAMTLWLRR